MNSLENNLRRNKTREATCRNLFYYPLEELYDYAKSDHSEFPRAQCVAEIFVREFLKKGSAEKELNDILPDGELNGFWKTLNWSFLDNREKSVILSHPLWDVKNEFSRKCHIKTQERLTDLCVKTDGFIPVYQGDKALFIPFHFRECDGDADCVITDLAGNLVHNWETPCARVFRLVEKRIGGRFAYRCVVSCDQSGLPVELRGNSLMMPLYLACLQKAGIIPYNPLRVIATGEIDETGMLKPVETKPKADSFHSTFEHACFFYPASLKFVSSEHNEVSFPKMDLPRMLEVFLSIVEAKGLFVPNYREAIERLMVLAKDRDANYATPWEFLLDRLGALMRAIPDDRNPQQHLLCLLLESSMYCHWGKTQEALTRNRKAQEFAKRHNLTRQLLRLQIEELVDLEDLEDYTAIAQSAEPLGIEIEKCSDTDLMMRYHGTMGQAHSFGALSEEPGFSKEKAKDHFDKALRYAFQKYESDDGVDAEDDIARDRNYIILWYALFDPESTAAQEAYQNAVYQIQHNLQGKAKDHNCRYLCQLKGMSLYRHMLQTGKAPEADENSYLLRQERTDDWLAALSGKYAGALMAAKGKKEEAEKVFEEYSQILKGNRNPVLQFIQMTILAEAFRSTGKNRYCELALLLAKGLRTAYPKSVPQWERYLKHQGEFPALKYWR